MRRFRGGTKDRGWGQRRVTNEAIGCLGGDRCQQLRLQPRESSNFTCNEKAIYFSESSNFKFNEKTLFFSLALVNTK